MTHGEAWFIQYQSEVMIDGVFVPTIEIEIPKPMSRSEAARYYNTKLFAYWMDCLDDSIPIMQKAEAISRMMFRDPNKHEMFKEKFK